MKNENDPIIKALVVLGMHRSMTSLVSQGLYEAGLYLGPDLIGPEDSNPDGHFESRVIVDFHRNFIWENKLSSWWTFVKYHKARVLSTTDEFKNEAKALLDRHFSESDFGWKDPRSAFFLSGWHHVLPDPHYIIVLRHPVACVSSLLRRSMRHSQIKYRPFLATRYFNLWDHTNKSLLAHLKLNTERCLVIETPDDLKDLLKMSQTNLVIRERWGFDIDEINFSRLFKDEYVSKRTMPAYLNWLYRKRKSTAKIYKELSDFTQD